MSTPPPAAWRRRCGPGTLGAPLGWLAKDMSMYSLEDYTQIKHVMVSLD